MFGVVFAIVSKSSSVIFIPSSFAMAIKCKTTLDEPPMALSIVIAFSKAFFVIIFEALYS